MTFAAPLPAWSLALLLAGGAYLVWRAGWLQGVRSLATWQRAVLVALRAVALLLLLGVLMRPVRIAPDQAARETVAVLVDVSRSMALHDAGQGARLEEAIRLVRDAIVPTLGSRFNLDLLAFGHEIRPVTLEELASLQPAAPATDLAQAMAGVSRRPRQPVGTIVVSDGGFAIPDDLQPPGGASWPVYSLGVGRTTGHRDVEVRALTAGDASVSASTVDLTATVASSGLGSAPVELRVFANGQAIESRRVVPTGETVPREIVFAVGPDPDAATLYTVEAAVQDGELTSANNRRSVLVPPSGRPRRVLLLEGAPGFEHSFLKRAIDQDRGLELDAVVRKGANDDGRQTYYVQASPERGGALTNGFPTSRQALFAYDAIVLANLEADAMTGDQQALLSEFVSERGGGLLVLGARTLQANSLDGTPLEELLPVEISDRGSTGVSRASTTRLGGGVELTADGVRHPVMRIAPTADEARARWSAMPALPSLASVGGARPGAAVLALSGGGGVRRPLVAVHRFGRGRVLAFTGEGSWRWRMMLPSTDTSYVAFWRQAVRWVGAAAPEPVTVRATSNGSGRVAVVVEVRDETFRAVRDADVQVTVRAADGTAQQVAATPDPEVAGAYRAEAAVAAGAARIDAGATHGGKPLGTASAWTLAGEDESELVAPRRDDAQLARLAERFGGRLVQPGDLGAVAAELASRRLAPEVFLERDVWQSPWILLLLLTLLIGEWTLRRRWGLR